MKKVEPKSTAVNPAAVSEIGLQVVRCKPITMYEGRGYKAPTASASTHRSGSQGKHGGK